MCDFWHVLRQLLSFLFYPRSSLKTSGTRIIVVACRSKVFNTFNKKNNNIQVWHEKQTENNNYLTVDVDLFRCLACFTIIKISLDQSAGRLSDAEVTKIKQVNKVRTTTREIIKMFFIAVYDRNNYKFLKHFLCETSWSPQLHVGIGLIDDRWRKNLNKNKYFWLILSTPLNSQRLMRKYFPPHLHHQCKK